MSGKMPKGAPWSVLDGLEDIYDQAATTWKEVKARTAPAVARGDLVAMSGNSGNAKRSPVPHLHYETFVDGSRVDPTTNYPDRSR